jgi:hypothetical protein
MHEPKLYCKEGPITAYQNRFTVASIGCTCGWNSDGESYQKEGDWVAHLPLDWANGVWKTRAERMADEVIRLKLLAIQTREGASMEKQGRWTPDELVALLDKHRRRNVGSSEDGLWIDFSDGRRGWLNLDKLAAELNERGPAPVGMAGLRELVAKWRERADECGEAGAVILAGALQRHADELEATLASTAEGAQAAVMIDAEYSHRWFTCPRCALKIDLQQPAPAGDSIVTLVEGWHHGFYCAFWRMRCGICGSPNHHKGHCPERVAKKLDRSALVIVNHEIEPSRAAQAET